MAFQVKTEWVVHWMLVVGLMMLHSTCSAAPLAAKLKRSSTEEPSIHHQYFKELYRCLKIRDNGADLFAAGCIPAVFSTMDGAPSYDSDTVSGYLAQSSIMDNNIMKLNFQLSQAMVPCSAVHLRIHKSKMQKNTIPLIRDDQGECDLQHEDGIMLSINVRNPQNTTREMITLQQMQISYKELVNNDTWLNFNSLESPISNYIHNNTLEFHLKLETAGNCSKFLTLEGIGMRLEKEYEPVLVLYTGDDSNSMIEKYANENVKTVINERRRRMSETGSGENAEFCHLIEHEVSHKHLGAPIGGKFKLNYCSGYCMNPMGGNPPLHTIIMGILAFTTDTDISNVTPVPCCVPTKYASLTVFIKEESQFPHYVIRTLTNMTAKECGCR